MKRNDALPSCNHSQQPLVVEISVAHEVHDRRQTTDIGQDGSRRKSSKLACVEVPT